MLAEPLRHVQRPRFRGVIFRRTYPEITNAGGLWDESTSLYSHLATPRIGDMEWRFPSGATIQFRHLQHETDIYGWQGAQVDFMGFDEITHFTEKQFFYLLSRLRSASGVDPYVRCTCNPDPGWVKSFLRRWVVDGHESGSIHWFHRDGDTIQWSDEPRAQSKSCTFVRASVFDNKILLATNPGYVDTLRALPEIERLRLLEGNWDVRLEGVVFPEFWRCVVPECDVPEDLVGTQVGGIDWGFHNPFAAVWGVLDHDDVLWIHGERYVSRQTLTQHAQALPTDRRWYADPAGADQIAEMRYGGHDVVPSLHLGRQPLLTGIALVTDRIASGRLKVSRACINLIKESGLYVYDKATETPVDADNHALAALRYLITAIDRGRSRAFLGETQLVSMPEPDPEPERIHFDPEWSDDD